MPIAAEFRCAVPKGGTRTFLARVVGNLGDLVTQAYIASAKYSIYLIDPDDENNDTAVEDHVDVILASTAVIFDTLQQDAIWTADATGYNFKHTPDVATHDAFTLAGRDYRVVYRFQPYAGQAFFVRFRVRCF